jgi:hypothetical protein
MANTIINFLVGLGFDVDDKGRKEFEDGLKSIESTTIKVGAAMTGALVAVGATVNNNARGIADVNNKAFRMSSSTEYLLKFGAAIKRAGGDSSDAVTEMQKLDTVMDELRVKGESGTLNELARAGFDPAYLSQAKDAEDLSSRIADQYQKASEGQRRVASDILGISDATAKLYSGGSDYLKAQVTEAGNLTHVTQDLIDKAAEYNQKLLDAQTSWDGLVNTATSQYLPILGRIADASSSAFKRLDEFTRENPDVAAQVAVGATTAAGGAALSTGAAVASKLGIPGAGIARAAGPVGVAAGTAIAAEPLIDKGLNSLFGDSEYFQKIRTAPTWSEFGMALLGQNESSPTISWKPEDAVKGTSIFNPTSGYTPNDVTTPRDDSHYEKQADATASALKQSPIQVNVKTESNLYLDSKEIDARVEEFNKTQNQRFIDTVTGGLDR